MNNKVFYDTRRANKHLFTHISGRDRCDKYVVHCFFWLNFPTRAKPTQKYTHIESYATDANTFYDPVANWISVDYYSNRPDTVQAK